MAIQIALVWSPECEKELKQLGFKETKVYIKNVDGCASSKEQKALGDSQFFQMKHTPFQFVTTSWWGAGPD